MKLLSYDTTRGCLNKQVVFEAFKSFMKYLIDSKYPFIRVKEMKSTYVYKAIHFFFFIFSECSRLTKNE